LQAGEHPGRANGEFFHFFTAFCAILSSGAYLAGFCCVWVLNHHRERMSSMASWRRKAAALFPQLRREIQRREFSIYSLYFELLPLSRAAHESGDAETLRRIYGFAEWCFRQKAKNMWNAAGVAFYEHVFDGKKSGWSEVVPWLPPNVVRDCWVLWEARLTELELVEIRRLLDAATPKRYLEARLTTGEAKPHRQ
jgi:hypothetical protein